MASELGKSEEHNKLSLPDPTSQDIFLPLEEDFDPFDPGAGLSFLVDSLFEVLRQKTEPNTLSHRFVDTMHEGFKDLEGTIAYCDALGQFFKSFEEADLVGDTDVHASFKIRDALSAAFRYRFEVADLIKRFHLMHEHGLFSSSTDFHPCVDHLMSVKGGSVFLAAMMIEFSAQFRHQDAQPKAFMMDWLDESVFNALKQDSKDYGVIWRPAYEIIILQLEEDRSKVDRKGQDNYQWNQMYNMCASYESLKARLRFHVAEWLPLRVLEGSNLPMEVQLMVQGYMRNDKLVVRFENYRKIECYPDSVYIEWYCECCDSECEESSPPHQGCRNCDRSVWKSEAEREAEKEAEEEAEREAWAEYVYEMTCS